MPYKKNISSEEINKLPVYKFSKDIILIETIEKLNQYIPILKSQQVIGFDTETKPCFKKGIENQNKISLIQLATNDLVILVRINKTGFVESIRELLSSKSVIKAGVAVRDDINGLKKIKKFRENQFVDLADMSAKLGVECNGLRNMAAVILGVRVSKSNQLSNWESDNLSVKQLQYAATDAYISLLMYNELKKYIN